MMEKYALFAVFQAFRKTMAEESMRSLSRKAKVSVSTAKNCIDYLYSKKILTRKIVGKQHQYALNEESFLTRQLKIAANAGEISDSGLVEEISKEYPDVQSIVWYGSTAKGLDSPKSDVDVVLLSRKPLKIKPLKAEERLARELSISSYTMQEWRKKALTDKAYYDAVIIDGICIFGEMPVVN
ncbi:nucleotidyltransferase domain-containing protein [Candidatus Woesearchaeota archaeon]|nr:nucleotidyltransferase domain-containing protein [Candidatus Woesearchaeota archaeon]